MELDLYQRRGLYGLGDATTDATAATPAATGLDLTSLTSGATSTLSTLTSGFDLSSMSPTTLLVAGAFGLWVLSSLFSGGKRAYGKVARPIRKRRKQKRELAEADEAHESRRKRILSGKSSSRGGSFF